jgi:hypothetical protein
MNVLIRRAISIAAMVAAVAVGLFWSGEFSPHGYARLVSTAEAIIGRPLTPVSYAGVARRSVYRGAGYGYGYGAAVVTGAAIGAAYGAAYAAPPIVTPACYQVVNAYGQIVLRCP